MIALIQRVTAAAVEVEGQRIAKISRGLLVFLGVEKGDDEQIMRRLVDKVLGYRIFSDSDGKMNLDVRQIEGQVLVVPQFTLAADTNTGLRPSFSKSASPSLGKGLFDQFSDRVESELGAVERGRFGADMAVELINDGPVTFWIQV